MDIKKLKKIAHNLMTDSRPKLHMEIDGRQLRMDGAAARAFGCGVDAALKVVAFNEKSSNEKKKVSEFKLEERFIVVKRKHLTYSKEKILRILLEDMNVPTVECVVIESDWPEYETVLRMIEDRSTPESEEGGK